MEIAIKVQSQIVALDKYAEKSFLFYARITGLSLLLMAIIALFANFFVFESLIVPGNAAARFNFLSVLQLIRGETYLTAMEEIQLEVQAMFLIDAFHNGWLIGLVFFRLSFAPYWLFGFKITFHA